MKNFFLRKTEAGALNGRLASEARRMYLPPAVAGGDHDYWSSLEQRIMSRVGDPAFLASLDSQPWWTVLDGWSRTGFVAAGIAVLVSAAILQNQKGALDENSAVYEYVSAVAAPEALAPIVDQNGSVLNYVLAR